MSAYPFRPIKIEVTPDHVKAYFTQNPAAMSALLDDLIKAFPSVLNEVLDDRAEDFSDFIQSGAMGV